MNWPCRTVAAACIVLGLTSVSSAGQVKIVIRDGLVTLVAKDATIREIFAEWARVGQTRVVNAERVPGGPVTLELNDLPELRALEIVLRSVAGFVAAPRAAALSAASVFDRIVLMPVSRPTVVPTSAPTRASTPSQPQFPQQRNVLPQPPNIVVDDQDEEEPLPNASMPIPGQFPGAQQPGMMTAPQPNRGSGANPNQPVNPQGNAPPYPNPYMNPYAPNPPSGGATQQPQPPASAVRPGMPTAPPAPAPGMPIKPPDPIIRD